MQTHNHNRTTTGRRWRLMTVALVAALFLTVLSPAPADASNRSDTKRRAAVSSQLVPVPVPTKGNPDIRIHAACRTSLGGPQVSVVLETQSPFRVRVQLGTLVVTGYLNRDQPYVAQFDGLQSDKEYQLEIRNDVTGQLIDYRDVQSPYCPSPSDFDYATSCVGIIHPKLTVSVFNDSDEERTYRISVSASRTPIELTVPAGYRGNHSMDFSASRVIVAASYTFEGENGPEEDTFARTRINRPVCEDDGAVTVSSLHVQCSGLLPLATVVLTNSSNAGVGDIRVTFDPEYSSSEVHDRYIAANSSQLVEQYSHSVYESVQVRVTREGYEIFSDSLYMACPQS